METKRKERSIPKVTHPYLALLIILAIVAVLVNIIPSGQYDRIVVDGRTIVDPSSYHRVDKVYSGIWNFFYSFYQGYCDASSLIAMVFFVGAGFGVVKRIGLLQTAISVFALKIRKLPFAVVSFLVMLVISAQVLFTGMWELNLVLLPVVIPLFMTLGYDLMTGVGVVMISSFAAFGCALTNPFSTAIAHQIAELPIYSAMGYRFFSFCIVFLVGWGYLMLYVRKVKKNKACSLSADLTTRYAPIEDMDVHFTPPLIRAGIVFLLIFGYMVYGTVRRGFQFGEMSACFAAMAILVGLVYGAKLNDICDMFAEGMKEMFFAGTVMLFARSILWILNETLVIDTVIHFLSQFVEGQSHTITAVLLTLIQTVINFLIPSGSGQAVVTMPIMVPLADIAGITRQTACLAFQYGDGFSNFIFFTNGSLIAMLMVADVPYTRWVKFFWKLFLLTMVLACLFCVVAVAIHLGPF